MATLPGRFNIYLLIIEIISGSTFLWGKLPSVTATKDHSPEESVEIQENVNSNSKKDGPIPIFSDSVLKSIKELKLSNKVYIKKEYLWS